MADKLGVGVIGVGFGEKIHIPGFQEIQLFRRDLGSEVEFITIMRFDDLESVRAFAGKDYEAAVVPPKARAVRERGRRAMAAVRSG